MCIVLDTDFSELLINESLMCKVTSWIHCTLVCLDFFKKFFFAHSELWCSWITGFFTGRISNCRYCRTLLFHFVPRLNQTSLKACHLISRNWKSSCVEGLFWAVYKNKALRDKVIPSLDGNIMMIIPEKYVKWLWGWGSPGGIMRIVVWPSIDTSTLYGPLLPAGCFVS